jgi:hypothetical protein
MTGSAGPSTPCLWATRCRRMCSQHQVSAPSVEDRSHDRAFVRCTAPTAPAAATVAAVTVVVVLEQAAVSAAAAVAAAVVVVVVAAAAAVVVEGVVVLVAASRQPSDHKVMVGPLLPQQAGGGGRPVVVSGAWGGVATCATLDTSERPRGSCVTSATNSNTL